MDNSHLYGEALSSAGRWVVRKPKLTHMLDVGDPLGPALLREFMRQPAVWAYLRTKRLTRHHEIAQQLLDKAHARINDGGQTCAIVALYCAYRKSGRLTDLTPSQFAVLRAVFGQAIAVGPTVLASLRYLAVAVESESGFRITPSQMRRVLMRLIALGLIEYEPGRRGYAQHSLTRSGRVNLANLLPLTSHLPDVDTLIDLELKPTTILALLDYQTRRGEQALYPLENPTARPGVVTLRSEDDSPDRADLAGSREHGRDERSYERFRSAAVDESVVEAKQHKTREAP